MAVFVGLDCGGSSSRVLAIDEHGKALFRGQSGPANLLSTPEAVLQRNLATAARGCPKPDAVCGCFAGLINSDERDRALKELQGLFPKATSYRAEPDYTAALAACGPKTDACVIAGTGSIICSWSDGKVVKSGGRGPILGDPGSAAEIGREMLSNFLDDPSSVSSVFKGAVLEAFKTVEDRGIVAALYASPSPAKLLASLGKSVAAEAEEGTEQAVQIIREEMHALARLVHLHLERFGTSIGLVRIGLSGGLWKSGAAYGQEFETNLTQQNPDMNFELFVLRKPPVEGAALLAKEAALVN
jgi:N-acetylglucosamine kinase-like BadF-type ATPase